MANSHVVGLPIAHSVGEDRSQFGSHTTVDPIRRHSMPAAPVTIETPHYARQQNVPKIGVRDSCVIS